MFELLTPAQMSLADRMTIESGKYDGFSLMLAAGRAVADIALKMFSSTGPIAVLCGPGNNGGDGYVAAQLLRDAGRDVICFATAEPRPDTDAMQALKFYKGELRRLSDFLPTIFTGIIDALYGAGLARNIDDVEAAVIADINASDIPVLAVDLPSGISGLSGQVYGAAINARATMTFFRKKPGHILQPGRAHCGVLHVANIGINDDVLASIRPDAYENAPENWRDQLPLLAINMHKYSRGHVAVFSGPGHATGAARLSAKGAARSGAGAVTVLSPSDAVSINATHLTSIMVRETRSIKDVESFIVERKVAACVLGPGYGNSTFARAHTLLLLSAVNDRAKQLKGLVLDADGITSFEDQPEQLFKAQRNAGTALVLTPHEGEFRRLFPDIADEKDTSKLDKARKAASRANAVVIYKGPDTVIASPDGRAAINSNGTPLLATAGSGDVLAGIVCGLISQAMPAFEAASAAVWMHADAARRFGYGLIAEDLPELLPSVLSALENSAA
ncbi:NAD(P)H-hydrate dehydratase [Brucella gallinifaecis]|uniref:Bifunctional NAD(P)H-hydrate repair enzyme n=1 Tax=Brucella gallinifaecis TaxID=215590 RepID=A0A502BRH4_9HYPH|nr:NAD(P)H-hydrate dehydratase [Brucella gallinifaecis]TPF75876.1 NAD(P)H-hydrate dehydratase [Brucella gallinifaecis]